MTVCLESLNQHNLECRIIVNYTDEAFRLSLSPALQSRIEFRRLSKGDWNGRRMTHRVELLLALALEFPSSSCILSLDCDLYFQGDPFKLFSADEAVDLFYTTCVMNSYRQIDYPVNGGVFGIRANDRSRLLLNFWLSNQDNPTWVEWANYPLRDEHKKYYPDWFFDQDFLNCIHRHPLPLDVLVSDAGPKFNYYTSKIGFFDHNLEMSSKIGNPAYPVIHWKGFWKSFYNLDRPEIYNLSNLQTKARLYRWKNKRQLKKIIKTRLVDGKYPWV